MIQSKEKIWNWNFVTILIVVFFHFVSVYLLLPIMPIYLITELNATTSEMSLILSGFTVVAFLISPLAGYLIDNFSRKPLILGFNIFFVIISILYIFIDNIWTLGINRAFNGAAYGMIVIFGFTMAVNSVKYQFKDSAMLYYGIVSKFGMSVAPAITIILFINGENFDTIFLLSAILSSAGLISLLFVNQSNQRKMDIKIRSTFDKKIFIKMLPETISIVLITFTYGIINNYLSTIAIVDRHHALESVYFFLLFGSGMVLSKFIIRRRIERGHYISYILFSSLCIIFSILSVGIWPNEFVLYIVALITGFCFELITVIFRRMFMDMSPSDRIGTGSSNYYMSWDLGMGLGIIMGGILSHHESVLYIFTICSLMIIISALFYKFHVYNHFIKHIDKSNL